MATYDHLPLKRLQGELERRKHGFGASPSRDYKTHGARIQGEIENSIAAYEALPAISGVDPSLILKVTTAANIDEDEWRKLGMTVLSVNGDQSIVLFASDATLQEFRRKVGAYQNDIPAGQKAPQYSGLVAAVESVVLLEPADRIGPTLAGEGFTTPDAFGAGESYTLDFELHRPGDQVDFNLFLFRLEQAIAPHAGVVLSTYAGNDMLLMRAVCNGDGVRAALELPEVAIVELPPQPDLLSEDIRTIDIDDLPVGDAPPNGAVVVGVIDTGVNFGHPLLGPTEAGSITAVEQWGTADAFGHGTSVAAIAAFGDLAARVRAKNFNTEVRIASARVTTDNGRFPLELSLPSLMESAIRGLHARFGCRIFNISLGVGRRIYAGGKPDPWTATLDYLARDLNVLIVVSAGNREDLADTFKDSIVKAYPTYLTEPASRIIEPATGANVFSVGSIAHANGLENEDEEYVGVRAICAREEPSPFTRTGPGIKGMVKPDLMDFGGNAVWDGPSDKLVGGHVKASAGVWTFHHAPIGNSLFASRSGTSFAAPNVAYKAALLLTKFPNASANLLRSLLALSAQVPAAARARVGLRDKELAMVCGYGVCDAEHAASSDDDRVVFYAEDELPLDQFAVFEIPIPWDFQTEPGQREIRVALAFDPPVRHTRVAYLGVSMGWRLIRGSSHRDVLDRFRKWEKEEGKPPEFENKYVCPTDFGSATRELSTLQIGTYVGKSDIRKYGDNYYLAVWCSRRWAPKDVARQKYAISVQLRHQALTTLYQALTTPVRVRV